jgi:hypothetical protein
MFRFNLAPAGRSAVPAASPLKALAVIGVGLMFLGLLAGWLLGHRGAGRGDLEPETGPILVAMQKMGQLHTVSFSLKDVLKQESQSEPSDWVSAIPGATEVTHWATHNQALVIAEGSVEAGVDLTGLSEKDVTRVPQADGTTVLRVHLPSVVVYPPNVHLRVASQQAGLFWNDENIVPKAQTAAIRLFLDAAEKQGIRATAQENAIQTLQAMQRALGYSNVEFTFQ